MSTTKTASPTSQNGPAAANSSTSVALEQRPDAMPAPEGSSVLTGEDGRTVVHNQVVAKIAGLAVQEVDGVHRLVPFGASQAVSSFTRSVTGTSMHEMGVHVEVGQREAAVDVRIISEYGASIPAITEAIRRNVSERIEAMTGLRIVEVNIDVVDLYFPEQEEDVERAPTSRVQ